MYHNYGQQDMVEPLPPGATLVFAGRGSSRFIVQGSGLVRRAHLRGGRELARGRGSPRSR